MRYVSLHSHSTFSTGDGHKQPKAHVARWVELGMKAGALTEHGNVSSWVALEQACEKAGVEPIFGIEIYFGKPGIQSKTHMILLAMTQLGLQNINRIVTKSWQQFYYSPTVYWEDLVKWNEGIIALSGCADSALSCTLLGGKYFGEKSLQPSDGAYERAVRGVRRFQKIFGDRYYLEVQRFPGLERTCVLNPLLAQISRDTGVPLVATSDVHYPLPEQNAIQRILHAADRGKDVQTVDASWEYDILLTYPKSDAEIFKDLKGTGLSEDDAKQAILATEEIARRCTGVRLPKSSPPKFGVESPENLLREWITIGWNHRVKHNKNIHANVKAYKERIKHEYETICAREGFADYFLIVADLVVWAKSQGIAVGPGRGSAAGSLVCYLLRITEIDSMQFPMLFERFLDPTRTDPPDIDLDFEDERRDEVFDYAARKYGSDRVANIANFQRYLGKSAIDDIARVYHIPSWKVDRVKSKLLEREEGHPRFAYSVLDTVNTFPEVAKAFKETPEFRYAIELESDLQNFSIHAAGMVIAGGDAKSLDEICATYERELSTTGRVAQSIPYDKRDAAYLGLLKVDLLSLVAMGEIAQICRDAGISLVDDLYQVPLDDEPTLQAFRDGEIMGIFQFEGITTRRILKAVQPTTFMHLADVNALSRPGANDKGYISNKNSGQLPEFAHDIIRHYTTEWPNTYGVLTYEEQILYVLRDLGGFEPAELNRMRKIIHDKLGSTQFNKYLERFIKGAGTHGLSENTARKIWDGMVSASGYAFNIAHSVSYAHIGYWQQWLKIHYPAAFYRAKFTKCKDNDKRAKFIQEADRMGIAVLPPDIMHSGHDWTLAKAGGVPTIVAGLEAIEGIGPKTAQAIIDWRGEIYTRDLEWDDLVEVKGIGKKTIQKIVDFVESDDPFGVQNTRKTLEKVRRSLPFGCPTPTHYSIDIVPDGQIVCHTGVLKKKKYYDAVEQLCKRENIDEYSDALKRLKDNHLIKYVALYVEDEYGETIRIGVNRWKYPSYTNDIENLSKGDVVVAQGKTSDWGGLGLQADEMFIIKEK
jgi:DNA polymerase-3 subunit alpha